jgi:chromosome segregation ATPase
MKHLTKQSGSIGGFHLYELTERDLRFLYDHPYKLGNVLLYPSDDPQTAVLGHERACAENERAARQYIASLSTNAETPQQEIRQQSEQLIKQLNARAAASSLHIQEHYDKVVEGLNAQLATLREENENLSARIAERTERIEALSFSLLTSDKIEESLHEEIANISTLQSQYRQELEAAEQERYVSEGKLMKEREHAMHLEADLVVFQGDLLAAEARIEMLEASLAHAELREQAVHAISTGEQEDVFQTIDGVVRVYHEFMPVPKKSEFKHAVSVLRHAVWVVIAGIAIAYFFFTSSILDSMRASGVPVSDFSDAVFSKVFGLLGF